MDAPVDAPENCWSHVNGCVASFRENKDMKARQGKVAVDTAKEVNNDKTIKNKADKERRLREKNQNNTKKFMEERKTMAIKQGKEKDKLVAAHTKQLSSLTEDIKNVIFPSHSFQFKSDCTYDASLASM